jgi:hypothetical protein
MNFADWQRRWISTCNSLLPKASTTHMQSHDGYVPDLHKIWVETSNDQLIALSNEYPGFYRYALVMEEASENERNKASRPYDGMDQFSPQQMQLAAQLLATVATLERGYQALLGSVKLQVFQPQVNEMSKMHRQWLADLKVSKALYVRRA